MGEWDWTDDEMFLTFDGQEGFAAIDGWDSKDKEDSTPWRRKGGRSTTVSMIGG